MAYYCRDLSGPCPDMHRYGVSQNALQSVGYSQFQWSFELSCTELPLLRPLLFARLSSRSFSPHNCLLFVCCYTVLPPPPGHLNPPPIVQWCYYPVTLYKMQAFSNGSWNGHNLLKGIIRTNCAIHTGLSTTNRSLHNTPQHCSLVQLSCTLHPTHRKNERLVLPSQSYSPHPMPTHMVDELIATTL